jgi:hypothetical protein
MKFIKLKAKDFLICILYLAIWVSIYYAITWLFKDSSCRVAYGLLSGWWSALYISALFEIRIKDLPLYSLILGIIFLIGSFITNVAIKLSDIEDFILFLSPMLVNAVVLRGKDVFKKRSFKGHFS